MTYLNPLKNITKKLIIGKLNSESVIITHVELLNMSENILKQILVFQIYFYKF